MPTSQKAATIPESQAPSRIALFGPPPLRENHLLTQDRYFLFIWIRRTQNVSTNIDAENDSFWRSQNDKAETRVLVLPITHTSPANPSTAVEIPLQTRQRLGLDFERSWIDLSEANEFSWPGADLRPIPNADPSTIVYGYPNMPA